MNAEFEGLAINASALLIVIFGVAAIFFSWRKEKHDPDYKTLFYIGLLWILSGLPMGNHVLWVTGAMFATAGLYNRGKWKHEKRWEGMTPQQREAWLAKVALLLIMLSLGILAYIASAT